MASVCHCFMCLKTDLPQLTDTHRLLLHMEGKKNHQVVSRIVLTRLQSKWDEQFQWQVFWGLGLTGRPSGLDRNFWQGPFDLLLIAFSKVYNSRAF